MCKLEDGFKFCTCIDEKGLEPAPGIFVWTLRRVNPKPLTSMIMGSAIRPQFSDDAEKLRQRILSALNQRDCFDFDYQPNDKDFLQIFLHQGNSPLQYAYDKKNECWKVDRSTSFSTWRQQLEPLKDGQIV